MVWQESGDPKDAAVLPMRLRQAYRKDKDNAPGTGQIDTSLDRIVLVEPHRIGNGEHKTSLATYCTEAE